MSCGLVNVFANTVGFGLALAMSPFLARETTESVRACIIVMFGNLIFSLLFLMLGSFFTAKLKRK